MDGSQAAASGGGGAPAEKRRASGDAPDSDAGDAGADADADADDDADADAAASASSTLQALLRKLGRGAGAGGLGGLEDMFAMGGAKMQQLYASLRDDASEGAQLAALSELCEVPPAPARCTADLMLTGTGQSVEARMAEARRLVHE